MWMNSFLLTFLARFVFSILLINFPMYVYMYDVYVFMSITFDFCLYVHTGFLQLGSINIFVYKIYCLLE